MVRQLILFVILPFFPGHLWCQSQVDSRVGEGLSGIQSTLLRGHVEFLADDALEGRGTGTPGYELAAKYVRSQFRAESLVSGTQDGSYFQKVTLRRTEVEADATSLILKSRGQENRLMYSRDFLLMDTHARSSGSVSAPVVFAGYGVTATELGYDDYQGIDVKGKLVALFFFEAPNSFPVTERAYYMDPQVKREIARSHGAVGIIEISSPQTEKRFPWAFLMRELKIGYNSMRWLQSNQQPFGIDDQASANALLSRSGADALFAGEQYSLEDVFTMAEQGKTKSFALSKTAQLSYKARHTPIDSVNVVGVVPGSDPALRKEYVAFTAHLDHLGVGPEVDDDSIYNGALDNAAGTAVLLAVSQFFAALPTRPRRSVVFVAVTGEEEDLLGSQAFARASPLDGPIVANINVDGGAFLFPVKDVIAIGEEHSSLGRLARVAAEKIGFELSPDYFPEEGYFIRSDQYSFVQAGIPSIYIDLGFKAATPGVDPLAEMKKWSVTTYHSPKDDTSQPIDYQTSARFSRFAALLAFLVANDEHQPVWKPNDFFGRRFCHQSAACPDTH